MILIVANCFNYFVLNFALDIGSFRETKIYITVEVFFYDVRHTYVKVWSQEFGTRDGAGFFYLRTF